MKTPPMAASSLLSLPLPPLLPLNTADILTELFEIAPSANRDIVVFSLPRKDRTTASPVPIGGQRDV
jgi:hypothetical protein